MGKSSRIRTHAVSPILLVSRLPMTPYKCGVTGEDISGLEKFEGEPPHDGCSAPSFGC